MGFQISVLYKVLWHFFYFGQAPQSKHFPKGFNVYLYVNRMRSKGIGSYTDFHFLTHRKISQITMYWFGLVTLTEIVSLAKLYSTNIIVSCVLATNFSAKICNPSFHNIDKTQLCCRQSFRQFLSSCYIIVMNFLLISYCYNYTYNFD